MNAVPKKVDADDYVSTRVYDGIRPIQDPNHAAVVRARAEKALAEMGVGTAPAPRKA